MSFFARSESGAFASKTVAAHLARGVIAAALITFALLNQSSRPAFAVVAGVLAVVALRGCPLCWTMGLLETIGARMRGRGRHTPSS
jgi:hypothetical protein